MSVKKWAIFDDFNSIVCGVLKWSFFTCKTDIKPCEGFASIPERVLYLYSTIRQFETENQRSRKYH